MEKIIRKLLLCMGGLITLAFASAPLSSFAETNANNGSGTVTVLISSALTLELIVFDDVAEEGVDNSMIIELSPNLSSSGRFRARVSSNLDYTLQLNGLNGATSMVNESDVNSYIPSTSTGTGGCTVAAGTSCWGVIAWPSTEAEPTNPTYSPIPATPVQFASGTGPAYQEDTIFEVGVSAGSDLSSGNYQGQLVVTASNS